jgi:hypothetical protein
MLCTRLLAVCLSAVLSVVWVAANSSSPGGNGSAAPGVGQTLLQAEAGLAVPAPPAEHQPCWATPYHSADSSRSSLHSPVLVSPAFARRMYGPDAHALGSWDRAAPA